MNRKQYDIFLEYLSGNIKEKEYIEYNSNYDNLAESFDEDFSIKGVKL